MTAQQVGDDEQHPRQPHLLSLSFSPSERCCRPIEPRGPGGNAREHSATTTGAGQASDGACLPQVGTRDAVGGTRLDVAKHEDCRGTKEEEGRKEGSEEGRKEEVSLHEFRRTNARVRRRNARILAPRTLVSD